MTIANADPAPAAASTAGSPAVSPPAEDAVRRPEQLAGRRPAYCILPTAR